MTNAEMFKNYIENNCKYCKNKETSLCNIEISIAINNIMAKCDYYERENKS